MTLSRRQYNTAVFLSVAGLLGNALFLKNPGIGAAFVVLYAAAVAGVFGQAVSEKADLLALLRGGLLLLSAYTFIGAGVYYLRPFTLPVIITLLSALAWVGGRLAFGKEKKISFALPKLDSQPAFHDLPLIAVALSAVIGAVSILIGSGTAEAIRSPWEVVPARFFLLLGLAVFSIVALAFRKGAVRIAAALAVGVLALGLSVGAIVYRIGYGFDPFIHEAAVQEIIKRGVVEPKTPYYIGAYVDLVTLSRLSAIPLHSLVKIAGPLAGATALSAGASLVALTLSPAAIPLAILLALFTPLSHFISTTPQGIADALALLSVAITFAAINGKERWLLAFAPALAALAVHPLSGIPALAAVTLTWISVEISQKRRRRLILAAGLVLLTIFPATAFLLQSALRAEISLNGARLRLIALASSFFAAPTIWTFSPERSLIYALRLLLPLIIVLLAVWRVVSKKQPGEKVIFTAAAATALGGALLAAAIRLPEVIAYEQTIFPSRFFSLAGIILFPLALAAALELIQKLCTAPLRRLTLSLSLALALVSAVYLAYPRVDPEERSGGRSVSAATVDAVDLIHSFGKQNSVVLGNQTAAAAEIWRYGFSRYVKGEFYYSHPSGSLNLYQYFLAATNNSPTRELMNRVMADYGADTVFLLLHDYWKNFPRLAAEAKKSADASWEVAGGKVMIFEYRR